MVPCSPTFRRISLLAIFALTIARPVLGQVFDLDRDREPLVALNGLWRFQPGDDPRWADPNFDDSKWALIRGDKSWSDQGYKNMSGTAWYRAKVLIPEDASSLSLYVPRFYTSYQIFADGKFVGGAGEMPPHEHADVYPPHVYAVPQPASNHARTLSLAIRVWHWPPWAMYLGGGLRGDFRIGATELVQNLSITRNHESAWSLNSGVFLALFEILAALAALAFFVLRPREKEYLWFGIMLLLSAADRCFDVYVHFHQFGVVERDLVDNLIDDAEQFASVAFYFRLMRGKRDWLFWSAVGSIAASVLFLWAMTSNLLSAALWNTIDQFLFLPVWAWILSLLIRRAVQGLPDARFLLTPVLMQQTVYFINTVLIVGVQLGRLGFPQWFFLASDWPFPFSLTNIADALFLIAMLALLVHRFTRTRAQEERFSNELEAAHVVQQVLIPEEIPCIPGFLIRSVYKPAGQVGGDFFQILPAKNGGVLAIIGDVSGKGMPAAMTVSLLVGTVRTLAHFTQSPGEILSAMNDRMLARSNGGFTTCLILRADHDGKMIVADAGHPAPYRNGAEIPAESGLPLGLAAGATYPESVFQLDEGDQLTLVTDGVVEARSKSGELFGFERTAACATGSAEAIAATAQDFGQDDDITVVTIRRQAVAEQAPRPLPVLALPKSPA